MLTAAPAVADSDKHRRFEPRYTYGSLVSQCNQRANRIGLRGHDRREFVGWCTDRGRHFAGRDWDRRDWERLRWFRDRYRDRHRDDWYWRARDRDRDRDWDDDWDDRYFLHLLDEDAYWYDMRRNRDWRYAALQDFLAWSLHN
jgi:hypothetical protein